MLLIFIHIFSHDILGFELFSSGNGDLFYQSNELDPYIQDKNVS